MLLHQRYPSLALSNLGRNILDMLRKYTTTSTYNTCLVIVDPLSCILVEILFRIKIMTILWFLFFICFGWFSFSGMKTYLESDVNANITVILLLAIEILVKTHLFHRIFSKTHLRKRRFLHQHSMMKEIFLILALHLLSLPDYCNWTEAP